MTRKSKIARLPNGVRQEVNERLRDGEPAPALLEWLNGLPPVKTLLERYFEGRVITVQNVSEWKNGGYLDWVRNEEARAWLDELKGGAEVLKKSTDGAEISQLFAARLAVEMTRLAQGLVDAEPEPVKRWERLCEVHKQMSRLRRDDMWNARTQVWQERWEQELKEAGLAKDDDEGPGKWMTAEERVAFNNRIYGLATPEDYEVLKAGRRRLLTPKAKKAFVAEMMNVSEEEEKEGIKAYEETKKGVAEIHARRDAAMQRLAQENGGESAEENPTKSNQIQDESGDEM